METWLKNHEFLASWTSAAFGGVAAVIALVGMIRAKRSGEPLNWNMITMRTAMLLLLAALVAPSTVNMLRTTIMAPLMFLLVAINMRTPR